MIIRPCTYNDFEAIYEIINDAAQIYKGVIPADCWHEPYMPEDRLQKEIDAGVSFWGQEENGILAGVMGIQDKGDVTLIRHAYIRTLLRNRGIGSQLLRRLEAMAGKPILIGTWAAATWAINFYKKNGYSLVSADEKNRLLKKYWDIPDRQIETSVVLSRDAHIKD
jgi:N-acetylglutamate synthase-like GNAT family acetyltransferase